MKNSLFNLFWQNSKLTDHNYLNFIKWLEEYWRTENNSMSYLVYPTEDLLLKRPNDKLIKIMKKRKSDRVFSDKKITEKQLWSLFYSFSQKEDFTRLVPSWWWIYPIEVFAFLLNVKWNLNKKIVYYNSDNHSLSIVNNIDNIDIQKDFWLLLEWEPSAIFVFVWFPDRVIQKYSERWGRFLLIETWHYAQNLWLRLVQEKMKWVEAGWLKDDKIKEYLKLNGSSIVITLWFAVWF